MADTTEPPDTAPPDGQVLVYQDGGRQVSRAIDHYRLGAILAVGYRVRSVRGTAFRQWATARLSELLVKGFKLDDEQGESFSPTVSRRAHQRVRLNLDTAVGRARVGCNSVRWQGATTRRASCPQEGVTRPACRSAAQSGV